QYVFCPCSREAVESCRYQSTKIYVYVTKARTIVLNCQDDWLRFQRRQTELRQFSRDLKQRPPQLLTFLFEVCQTLLFCVDWRIDMNAIPMRTDVFAELTPEEAAGRKREVNI
ncbi:hypothetical protein AAVH_43116, partial [Aphelenchoides avenae]